MLARRILLMTTIVAVLTSLVPSTPAHAGVLLPPPRQYAAFAYDAAHNQDVLFGGWDCVALECTFLSDTWLWDGNAWMQASPPHTPPARYGAGMAYDAARGNVVLFGGFSRTTGLNDTWIWNGTDWHKLTPAHSPSARARFAMAYDAVRAQVVLFGGVKVDGTTYFNDTWTWDGSDWTQQSPAHAPTARSDSGMTDDQGNQQVVLFGGYHAGTVFGDTWTWDGSDWTQQVPPHAPVARGWVAEAYDPTGGRVVLFGGATVSFVQDTWTWDGSDWTGLAVKRRPQRRAESVMAVDPASGGLVLFGGAGPLPIQGTGSMGDTWRWNGTSWRIPYPASVKLTPTSGPPGTTVQVRGTGYGAGYGVAINFVDSSTGTTTIATVTTDQFGSFSVQVTVPGDATLGGQTITANQGKSGQKANATFTVS